MRVLPLVMVVFLFVGCTVFHTKHDKNNPVFKDLDALIGATETEVIESLGEPKPKVCCLDENTFLIYESASAYTYGPWVGLVYMPVFPGKGLHYRCAILKFGEDKKLESIIKDVTRSEVDGDCMGLLLRHTHRTFCIECK